MRIPQLLFAAVLTAASVSAQDAPPPSHISFVEGSAVVRHASSRAPADPGSAQPDSEPAVLNMPIVEGDRIQTFAGARVEVMFPDGGSIAIESNSEVEFLTATRVRVVSGAIEHLPAQPVDPRSPSAQNLPPDLQTYGPQFDQYGSWQYESQYGNVWYPAAVAPDWRPYYDGYWASYPAYGWTWIGYERWAWPTHHYGRWGYTRNRWFWIPGRSYASAWVSWGTAPGYVSWCPLGYDGRAVVGLSTGLHNSWNAWTVVPRDRFGARGYSTRRYAVEPYRIASSVPFIEHQAAPARERRGNLNVASDPIAIRPRGDNPPRVVGTAVPRAESTGSTDLRNPGYRAASPEQRVPGFEQREQRAARPEQQAPTGEPRPTVVPDHPAYLPRYQPQYAPDNGPRGPRGSPGFRDRTPSPVPTETRPSAQPRREAREAAPAPAPPAAPAAPARTESAPPAPRNDRPSAPPAREPHAAPQNGRPQDGNSVGTAVRRPR